MICYHGTPMSGPAFKAAKILAGRDAMVSFYAPEQLEVAAEVCRTVVLDNGAFSAWKTGKPVSDWSAYYAWVDHWRRHPSIAWACIPDVIDGDEEENNALLAEWPFLGFGVPVWHLHESLHRLEWLAEAYPIVALGSSGEYSKSEGEKWWNRMSEAMECVCIDGQPITKLHGLRMLDPTILAHLPLASADSTNVARNIGLDTKWSHPYAPKSIEVRAAVIMDRIESHAKASRWCGSAGIQRAFELLDCS